MRAVVVTGASSGIGLGCAKVLLKRGFQVFGSVRNRMDADRLSRELGANFTALIFDVTDKTAVALAAERVAAELGGETLLGLVNNAGIAVLGPLLDLDVDDFRHQLDVNVAGALIVTQAFAPLLGVDPSRKGPPGRIVMMSSVAGRNAYPFIGAYCTSKFALEGMSESLRREMMLFGIDVVVIGPGVVVTPIWDKATAVDVTRYANTPYAGPVARLREHVLAAAAKGLSPERIGEAVMQALTVARPKARARIAPDPISNWIAKALPRRAVDRIIAGRLGLTHSAAK
jgi:NAD(P)-dependent dehydrogenase (short-subunit alcohol dehydrogenase family)